VKIKHGKIVAYQSSRRRFDTVSDSFPLLRNKGMAGIPEQEPSHGASISKDTIFHSTHLVAHQRISEADRKDLCRVFHTKKKEEAVCDLGAQKSHRCDDT
jgi:hypothetical protein